MIFHNPKNDLNDFRIEFCERLAEIEETLNDYGLGEISFRFESYEYKKIMKNLQFIFSVLHDEEPK